jgi:alpha-D-xyloside xylohydrolase
MVENSKTGAPIMRPMFYHFSDDEICYTLDDQYMFGADILFAPIYEQGCTSRKVYLPKGEWILTKDGTKYEGAQWIEVEAKIDEFIAFVREGSEVVNLF